ncbi:MAG: hypothetical protein R6V62_09150 [Candidatus Fermentibacteraceae bacterium]
MTALLAPFRNCPPFTGLLTVSLVFGVIMILIFKFASNQRAIGAIRSRMGARALGMLLHLHSPVTVIKTAAALMADNFAYLWRIITPMLVIAVPFILTAAALDARYGSMPVPRGVPTTVTLTWDVLPAREGFSVTGTGITVIEPVVFVDTLRQTSFRVQNANPGATVTAGGVTFPLGASAEGSGPVIYRGAARMNAAERLLKPFLAPLPNDSPVIEVTAGIPEARYSILGGRWSWLTVFLVYSSLAAIAGAAAFKVKV